MDGKPVRRDDGGVKLGIAVDVEKKDGSRTLMVPVIRDAGRLSFSEFKAAFDALIDKARTNTLSADDLVGAQHHAHEPGRHRHVASVPRLMVGQGTIVATGSIAYPAGLGNVGAEVGAEKVMSMTSTYDHRIIQGAESGRFLKTIEAYLQGENGFYEARLRVARRHARPGDRGAAAAGRRRRRAAPRRRAAAARPRATTSSCCRPFRPRRRWSRRTARTATSPRASIRSARADRRPGARPGAVHLTPELMRRIPSKILRIYVEGENLEEALPHLREVYCGTIAYEIEHIASHRQRALAARADRGRRVPQAAEPEERAAAAPADRRRRARALPAQGLPRAEAVLDRGPRHDGPDDRRG